MKYCVAIKLNDYSAEFSFDSIQEREGFITVTRALHPEVEMVLSEGSFQKVASA